MTSLNSLPLEVHQIIVTNLEWLDQVALKVTCRSQWYRSQTNFVQRVNWLFDLEASLGVALQFGCDLSSDKSLCANAKVRALRKHKKEQGRGTVIPYVLSLNKCDTANPQWWLSKGLDSLNVLADSHAVIRNWKRDDAFLDVVVAEDPSHGIAISSYAIYTMGQVTHATGFLHSSDNQVDFRICTAYSIGFFVAESLLKRIPILQRPPINTNDKRSVQTLTGPVQTLGSAMIPFYVVDETQSVRLHFTLKFQVLPRMSLDMLVPARYFNSNLSRCADGGQPQWSSQWLKPAQMLAFQKSDVEGHSDKALSHHKVRRGMVRLRLGTMYVMQKILMLGTGVSLGSSD